MANKKSTKTSKSRSKKTAKKSTRKSTRKSAPKVAPKVTNVDAGCAWCKNELEDEHRVLSHLMYILFLFSAGFAAIFTIFLFTQNSSAEWNGLKALVLIGWAFLFKMFGHRIHVPHH